MVINKIIGKINSKFKIYIGKLILLFDLKLIRFFTEILNLACKERRQLSDYFRRISTHDWHWRDNHPIRDDRVCANVDNVSYLGHRFLSLTEYDDDVAINENMWAYCDGLNDRTLFDKHIASYFNAHVFRRTASRHPYLNKFCGGGLIIALSPIMTCGPILISAKSPRMVALRMIKLYIKISKHASRF